MIVYNKQQMQLDWLQKEAFILLVKIQIELQKATIGNIFKK